MIVGKNVTFNYPIPDIKEGILKCIKTDTVITSNNGRKEYRFNKTYKEMQYDSISSLKLRIDDNDATMTVLVLSGLILGTIAIVLTMKALNDMDKAFESLSHSNY
jgi:hypothetical protein